MNDISDHDMLESMILTHAESVARRLRRDAVRARTVVLKWKEAKRTAPGPRGYPLRSRQVTLGDATDDGMTVASAATGLLRKSGPTVPIRLIGVGCTNLLEDVDSTQTTLFHDTRMHKRNDLNRTLDRIDDRFGQGTVTRATQHSTERAGLSMQVKRGDGE